MNCVHEDPFPIHFYFWNHLFYLMDENGDEKYSFIKDSRVANCRKIMCSWAYGLVEGHPQNFVAVNKIQIVLQLRHHK